jgi:hemoglobin
MRFVTQVVLSITLAGTATVVHADDKAPPKMEKTKSLYDRLGGQKAITAVVKEFLGNVAADKRINARFAKTNIPKLQQNLIDQITVATGGPGKYKGKSMAEAHKGMKITDDEFTALVEDLVKALDKFKVPETEKNELLGALGKLKPDIVGK